MFITGPDVVKTVTGEEVTFEELGGAVDARDEVRRRALHRAGRARRCSRTRATSSRSCRRTTSRRRRSPSRPIRVDREAPELDTLVPDEPDKPYDMKRVIAHVVDDGDFLEVHERYAENIVCGFARLGGHAVGVVGNQPSVARRRARHRLVGQGGALRAHLRRVQHPARHVRRRAGLPARARRRSGAASSATARSCSTRTAEATVPKLDGDHAQGLRRRLRRHELEAHPRRLQLRLADRGGRGDGARGRGQHRLPPGARGGRRPRGAPRAS